MHTFSHGLCVSAIADSTAKTKRIEEEGGIKACLVAMHMHRGDAIIQREALFLLSLVARNVENGAERISSQSATETVLKSMLALADDSVVVAGGCLAIAFLAAVSDSEALRVLENGGVAIVVDGMWRYGSNIQVQEFGSLALCNMSFHTVEIASRVADRHSGVVNVLLNAISNHKSRALVCANACCALGNMARDSAYNGVLICAATDSASVVTSTMLLHADNADVQAGGAFVLDSLAQCSSEMVSLVAVAGGHCAVLSAMMGHVGDQRVQENGVSLSQSSSVHIYQSFWIEMLSAVQCRRKILFWRYLMMLTVSPALW